MEESAEMKMSDMACEEEPMIAITKFLLSKVQLLRKDLDKLMDLCTSADPPEQRPHRMLELEGQANIEEDGETLIIDGSRFESAASREDLRRLTPLAGGGGGESSDGRPRGSTSQGQGRANGEPKK